MNADIKKLCELYHSNHLVPFIGTELSTPFNVPDWGDLIKYISNKYVNGKI